MFRIEIKIAIVKGSSHAPSRALPGYTIQQRGRKTIITINEGAIVITLKPP